VGKREEGGTKSGGCNPVLGGTRPYEKERGKKGVVTTKSRGGPVPLGQRKEKKGTVEHGSVEKEKTRPPSPRRSLDGKS